MLTIRPARSKDHRDLEALLQHASLATGEQQQALMDNPDAMQVSVENLVHTLVAEIDGRIAGFCTVLPLPGAAAELDALFIDPTFWRKGLGKALYSAAERQIELAGATSLTVVSGQYAQPFYAALGFDRAGVEMTRFGPAVRLSKRLDLT